MPPDKSRSSSTKLGFLILFILILTVISSKLFLGPLGKSSALINPKFIEAFNLTSTFSFVFKSQQLQKIVAKNLDGKKGEYAVVIEDLTDSEGYSLRDYDKFSAASLYKVYLLAAVFKEIEDGRLNNEDKILATREHLEEVFGGTDFGYDDAPEEIEYTVEEALARVGRISDNFAAIMLAEKIGWGKVQGMADRLGAKETTIKSPISTSAADIANFYKFIFCQTEVKENFQACQSVGESAISAEVARQMMETLSLSKINDRIPAKLPEEVKIIHKTGELGGIRHDAGIVYLEGRPYIIVLMSQDLKYEDQGVETLAQISRDVYEYFANKGK